MLLSVHSLLHIVVDFHRVIGLNCRWGIKQRSKKIFFDIPDLCRTCLQAVQHIFDVPVSQLQELASDDFRRVAIARNQDILRPAKDHLQD